MALDVIAWHDRGAAEHDSLTDTHGKAKYRFLALSVYGTKNNPFYAAVMIRRTPLVAQRSFHHQTAAQFQTTFNEQSKEGFGPYIVSATGSATDPLIASVFQRISPTPVTGHRLTEAEFLQANADIYQKGGILQWADAYGSASNLRYIAVWYPNTKKVEWNCGNPDDSLQNSHNDSFADFKQRFAAYDTAGQRVCHIARTPKPGILSIYTDDQIGDYVVKGDMTSQEYDEQFNDLHAQGLVPIRLSAHGTLSNSRFAAVFARTDKPKERTFRTNGPQGMAAVPAVDAAVETFMKAHGLHNASLAIVEGRRLVYAKGYTWAAPGYPDATPTTLYRQASISKALNAIALYRWTQLHPEITLETRMQDVLQLTTPTGGSPTDPDFEDITLQHLLESTSGLNNDIIWHDVQPRDAFGATLPITPMQLARWGLRLT